MRDPDRIPRLLAAVEAYWRRFPDLRLGQLMAIMAVVASKSIFSIEDEQMLAVLQSALKSHVKKD
jgi:hypothetical protein